jgi:hypothetical protein
MAGLTVAMAFFDELPEPDDELGWRVIVKFAGTGFVQAAMPIVAMVGDFPVEGLLVDENGGGAVGFLREIPPTGAPLKVGYLDTGLEETDFRYPAPVVG